MEDRNEFGQKWRWIIVEKQTYEYVDCFYRHETQKVRDHIAANSNHLVMDERAWAGFSGAPSAEETTVEFGGVA